MFEEIVINKKHSIVLQIRDYIKELIISGMLQSGVKLPSTRELSILMKVSRNSCIKAYEELELDGFIYQLKNKGAFVQNIHINSKQDFYFDWNKRLSTLSKIAVRYDLIKNTIKADRNIISFRGISPEKAIFDIDAFRRAFLNIMAKEGSNLLSYGYAKGYKPLIEYLTSYMKNKGVDVLNKDILITNGFTEGFDIVLNTILEPGDKILCENPTHNTAIKIMKMNNLIPFGVEMEDDGININILKDIVMTNDFKAAYLVPSYHNPTGIVMSPEKRNHVYDILKDNNIPIIEDGFNEELRYSGAHIAPLAAFCGKGNGVIYIGSFSKILFPGLRVGWILADKGLISSLESVKKSKNIHTSFLDQGILYEYLQEDNFEKFIKRSRKLYSERYDFAMRCAEKYIPYEKITGAGGMNIFITLPNNINSEKLLEACHKKGVIFMPGKIFYLDGRGLNTIRLGFANMEKSLIEKGFEIIGETVREYINGGKAYS